MRAEIIQDGGPEELLDGEIWVGGHRRIFTRNEVELLLRAGVLKEGEPEELLGGELWVMPAEGRAHINLKSWLNEVLVLRKPQSARVACDTTLLLSDTYNPSPDFYLFPSTMLAADARGPDILLLIEIADTSVRDDLLIKGPKYREHGVREYWVIDLAARVTHVHRLDGAWPETPPVAFDAGLSPTLAPELRLRIADSGV